MAEPAAKKARTGRTFLFSSESVNEGHPDKICDQVSDAVLDACLKVDPKSKVACETATKDNMVMVAGEITTQAKLDYDKVVRGVVEQIGFDSFVDDLSSVDSKGLSFKTCEVLVRINKQSPDIAGGVHVGKDEMDVGAGDQGIMFGYASDETSDCMPLTHSMATRLGKTLTDVRKSGECWWLRPDGKTQVTIEYLQHPDGSVEPKKIHTVVISTQHAEPLKAVRSKECAGYKGTEMTAPSMEQMNKEIEEKVIKRTLESITLKSGKSAITLYGSHTHLHINPSGKFIIGGPQGDAGLTGRKIIIDTYGGWGAHGGGAFSGKDPTKVDRSAAYICRQMAKSVVNSGLSARCLVQLSYAIGVAKPLSLFVETYGSERGDLTVDDITNILKIEFDCRPGAIAQSLALREPKYQDTAAYCHFGREAVTKAGIKFFEWENPKDLSKYKAMKSDQVEAALKSSNYLTKWVPAAKKARTGRTFLFSSESVNEGHPDKICDQVSDAVLDACLKVDPKSKVACETATKDNMVMVAGEITTQAKLDYDKVVRGVVEQIGFDSFVDDLSSVDSKGLSFKTCEVLVRINKQSPDIAGGVHVGKDEMDVGAGDQGIMFGYASDETSDCMPLTHSMATRLGKTLTDVRKSGECWWLRPDGKTQVTIEYLQHPDGSVEPKKPCSKECAGYKGTEMTAPSMEQMNKEIEEKVIKRTLESITLKSGKSAITLCLVQLSYAIGVAKPLSLFVETYGSERGDLTVDDITNILKIEFDCRPGAIAQSLALREPKYQDTAAYCHFGREAVTKAGIKFFEWENPKDLSKYKAMKSDQVEAALKSSNYLTKMRVTLAKRSASVQSAVMAEPAAKKARTGRTFLFSSESVNEGHPDKICDQVSDAVLDACLKVDPKSKVACETATKDNMVMVAGEITTQAKLTTTRWCEEWWKQIGFDSFVDDLSSVDSKGLKLKTCEVLVPSTEPDIAAAARGQGIEYLQHPDGSVEPKKIHTVVISTQHAEPLKAVRSKECAGYKGTEMTAPSMEQMNKEIEEKVIKRTLESITLKSGKSAITLCLVQLSYAIGVAKPLSLFVETYGSERGDLTVDDITNILKIEFDCRPGAIAQSLALREPKYQDTAAYCHFGREAVTKAGIKFFEWENPKDLSKYKAMKSDQVEAALKSSNYLTKMRVTLAKRSASVQSAVMAEPAAKKARTGRTFLFSSESVNEGHPDKICDQVSDAVLDACLKVDPKSKVACETATKDNMVMVAGEITTQAKLDYDKVVRGVVEQIGFDSFVDDLSSVDSKGLSFKTCEVLVRIKQRQGIMFGYASDETSDCMPLTHSMATRLGKTLTDVRKSGECWWLRPDGKTQVTIEYLQHPDGSVEPKKIHTVVISTQHAEPLKAVRSKECAGYKGTEMTAPSMEQMNKEIEEKVIKRTLESITLKSGKSAITLCLVQLSYAIGVAKPLSLFVETYGSERGDLTVDDITNILKIEFDCRPGAIAQSLALREPKYQDTAAYCHFGREAVTKAGIKFFEWENPKDLSKYKAMKSDQVEAALKSSNYLTKWVPAAKKARTGRTFLFSSESVNEGHPDKICDQVSDAVLDACLKVDPKSKVACETATKDNMVMVAGEITTQAKLDYDKVVRGVVEQIGFDSFVDDLSSVDSKGLSFKTCEVLVRINKQSPDIAGGVHVGKDEMDVGAGDQGIMFGYASDETSDCMPLTHSMATRLGKTLTDVRKSGECWWLRPDGKTQVTIEYLQHPDGSVEPKKIHTVVISTQHAEPLKAVRSKECAGYKGTEMTAPSMEQMNKEIEEKVIKRTLESITLKSGKSAITLCLVQLSYAIGVAKPLSLFVETYGSERGDLTVDDITNILKIEFDCRPGAIAQSLALREPKYQDTAAYCHFGREAVTKAGIKFFEWENPKDLSKYKAMKSDQVEAALKSSNYLTKWVD
ncbi:unnamed protein product [Effrenium voratum]|uniref:S-adenosylmethionine synthase n=1 Tax=Effrenium voratum TaxID=2562239 RepID=A0AA36N4N5_9DINO|nr:unnamed protein product [Effrenium voratum]